MKKRQRKQMYGELYDLLWHYRFAGGISTHDMAEALVNYIEVNYRPRKGKGEQNRKSLGRRTV
jgi:hypothetical protein